MAIGRTMVSLAVAGVLAAGMAWAQEGGAPPRGDRGADFRQQAEQQMKENMGVTEAQWKVLQPKIEKVTRLSMQMRMAAYGGLGARGLGRGPGARGDNAPAPSPTGTELEQKANELRAALEKDTPADEITQKLKEFNAAREKVRTELAQARADLRQGLTPRQEAYLSLRGLLE